MKLAEFVTLAKLLMQYNKNKFDTSSLYIVFTVLFTRKQFIKYNILRYMKASVFKKTVIFI